MRRVTPVTERDRAHALGLLFRGIAHENANSLNAILMNAELGRMSAEEAPDALRAIAEQARAGGELVKGLAGFVRGSDLAPNGRVSLSQCLDLARRLLASKAHRCGVRLGFADEGTGLKLPLDRHAAAVTLALLLDALCDAGAHTIEVDSRSSDGACEIRVRAEAETVDTDNLRFALRFARQLAEDHGGAFEDSERCWTLRLPL